MRAAREERVGVDAGEVELTRVEASIVYLRVGGAERVWTSRSEHELRPCALRVGLRDCERREGGHKRQTGPLTRDDC